MFQLGFGLRETHVTERGKPTERQRTPGHSMFRQAVSPSVLEFSCNRRVCRMLPRFKLEEKKRAKTASFRSIEQKLHRGVHDNVGESPFLLGRRPRPPVKALDRQDVYSKSPRKLAFTPQNRTHSQSPAAHEPTQTDPRACTPMGRSAKRWPDYRKQRNEPAIQVETVGKSISAASALSTSNITEQVSLYLRTLWSQSTRSGAPLGQLLQPTLYDQVEPGPHGLLTIQEHQRVLANCLRDFTSRLGLAYRQSMLKQGSVAEFKSAELTSRVHRLNSKLEETSSQLDHAHNRINRLEKKCDTIIKERDSAITELTSAQVKLKRFEQKISMQAAALEVAHGIEHKIDMKMKIANVEAHASEAKTTDNIKDNSTERMLRQ